MSPKTTRILALVVVAAVAALVAAAALLFLGGGESSASKADYTATVVNAVDRVDFALVRITKSTSEDELIERIDEASAVVGAVAADLDDAGVAEGFESTHEELVDVARAFSDELAGTAEQFRDPTVGPTLLQNINSLGFESWDKMNGVLADLQEQGLDVEQLPRH